MALERSYLQDFALLLSKLSSSYDSHTSAEQSDMSRKNTSHRPVLLTTDNVMKSFIGSHNQANGRSALNIQLFDSNKV